LVVYTIVSEMHGHTNIKVLIFSLIFCTTFVRIISHSKKNSVYTGLHVKYPLFLSDLNETWIFSTDFRKILKYQISSKSVQWEPSCSMRTDRRS